MALTFISITNVCWINTHQPLDLVPGCAVHLTATTRLGISPNSILLPDPILRRCSGAYLAAQVSSFFFKISRIAFAPLQGVCASACIGLARRLVEGHTRRSRPSTSATLISAAMHRA